jgi:hypothetical protein
MAILKTFAGSTLLLAAALTIAGPALGESSEAADSPVKVTWTNPQDFSDAKQSPGSSIHRPTPEEWLTDLAKHLRYRADRALPPGDRLEVTFTDVQRAGIYEPWRGPRWDDVRVIKDIYPPRIDLTFRLTDANGALVKEGKRELRDPAFLQRGIANRTDPLRFEKRMLDDWLRSEFPAAARDRDSD